MTTSKEITLERGDQGLGFNLSGGTDYPHVSNHYGIFVTKIREGGAAEKEGSLKEGDQIIKVNNTNLIDVTHQDALNALVNSDSTVTLHVLPGQLYKIQASQSKGYGTMQIVIVASIVVMGAIVAYRLLKR